MVATETVMRSSDVYARFGRGHVRHQLSAGRWQRPARGVVVLHNGPLQQADRDQIALLGCAPGAVLGGLTALTYDGFDGVETDGIHVVLPEGADRPLRERVVPHWSTMLTDADVHPLRIPRRTRPQRSLVDAASWSSWSAERRARAIILAEYSKGSLGHAIYAMRCRAEARVGTGP